MTTDPKTTVESFLNISSSKSAILLFRLDTKRSMKFSGSGKLRHVDEQYFNRATPVLPQLFPLYLPLTLSLSLTLVFSCLWIMDLASQSCTLLLICWSGLLYQSKHHYFGCNMPNRSYTTLGVKTCQTNPNPLNLLYTLSSWKKLQF